MPAAYGSCQARGQIGVAAEAYAAATVTDPSHVCDLHHSLWEFWILNPLSEGGQGSNLHPHGHCIGFLTH